MTAQPEPSVNTSGNGLYCQYGCAPATILVIIKETPGIPCGDNCARHYYGVGPYRVRLARLAGYVDLYAAAKEADLATPEQITGHHARAAEATAAGAMERAAPVPARSHATSVHRDARIGHRRVGDVPAEAPGMSLNWRVDDPTTETDERMALQARGPLCGSWPDDPAGTKDETGEP